MLTVLHLSLQAHFVAREADLSRSTSPGCPSFLLLGGFRHWGHQQVTSGTSQGISDLPVCHSLALAQAAFLSGSGSSSFPRSEASGGEGFLLLLVVEGFANVYSLNPAHTAGKNLLKLSFETLEPSFIMPALINCAVVPGPLSS